MIFNTKNKGFTLVELLVVISIIGLLSSVVLGSLTSARTKAFEAKTRAELAQIRLILEQYYVDNGGYPYPLPDNEEFYCLGSTCMVAGTPGTEFLTEFVLTEPKLPSTLAALPIPSFNDTRVVDGYMGYAYFACDTPTEVREDFFVCSGEESEEASNIQIFSTAGYIDSQTNFRLLPVTPGDNGGSDSGSGSYSGSSSYSDSGSGSYSGSSSYSDSGSGSYSGSSSYSDSGSGGECMIGDPFDYDCDGVADGSDNCIYTHNPDQSDNNGYDDYSGDGDACESGWSNSGSGSYSGSY